MTATPRTRFILFLLILVCLAVTVSKKVSSQCCAVPSSEVSAPVSQQFPGTISEFDMTISDTAGTNFDGRQVQETPGFQGTNTCYYDGGPTVQHPAVSNPGSGVPPWVVGTNNVTGATEHNRWGLDLIGIIDPRDVDQIRNDRPDLLPCTLVIFQDMFIECDASLQFNYEQNNPLEIFIHADHVENCRKAQLDSSNRCEILNR